MPNRYPGEENGDDSNGPYANEDDDTNTGLSGGRAFSDKQRARLIAININRNDGVVRSDYAGLDDYLPDDVTEDHDVLTVPRGLLGLVNQELDEMGLDEYDGEVGDANDEDCAQIDHIIPKGHNGANVFKNAAICSRQCNISLNDRNAPLLIEHFTRK